jgi:hypothetical protein
MLVYYWDLSQDVWDSERMSVQEATFSRAETEAAMMARVAMVEVKCILKIEVEREFGGEVECDGGG